MTPQKELDSLLARKAKADALPPEVRAKNLKLYTGICLHIAALTAQLRKRNEEIASPPVDALNARPETAVAIAGIFALDNLLGAAMAEGREDPELKERWLEAWRTVLSFDVLIENGFTEVQVDVTDIFGPA